MLKTTPPDLLWLVSIDFLRAESLKIEKTVSVSNFPCCIIISVVVGKIFPAWSAFSTKLLTVLSG